MENKVKVFGRRGSAYKNKINQWMGGHPIATSHFAVNYGLQGEDLDAYKARNPMINQIPVLNEKQFGNKFQQVQAVLHNHEPAPLSWVQLPHEDVEQIIVKPMYSLGGRGIELVEDRRRRAPDGKYFQERIINRRYEMRVHAFAWVDPEKWLFQKRVHDNGENEVAWNFHNGGRFITVENPHDPLHNRIRESVKNIMKTLGYQFGAVDFIIQNPGRRGEALKHYFIEWNLAPGWNTDSTEAYYKESFEALKTIEIDLIQAMIQGIYPWDIQEVIDQDEAHADRGMGRRPLDNVAEWVWEHRMNPDDVPENDEAPVDEAPVRINLEQENEQGVIGEDDAWQGHIDDVRQRIMHRLYGMPHREVEPPERVERREQNININFCPRCGAHMVALEHIEDRNYCFACGLRLALMDEGNVGQERRHG